MPNNAGVINISLSYASLKYKLLLCLTTLVLVLAVFTIIPLFIIWSNSKRDNGKNQITKIKKKEVEESALQQEHSPLKDRTIRLLMLWLVTLVLVIYLLYQIREMKEELISLKTKYEEELISLKTNEIRR